MGVQLFANFIETTLAADITDVATSLTLTSDSGFPTISGGSGDWFMMVLVDSTNAPEIVKCTARTGTTCTITRAQEGTSARAWTLSPTTAIYLPTTKGSLEQIQDDITAISDLIGGNDAGDIITTDGTQTLTNKTLTSPVINTGVSGAAIIDDDTGATVTNTTLWTGESIKAYVDNSQELKLFYESSISTSDTSTIAFSSEPKYIKLEYSGVVIHDTSFEAGFTSGHTIIEITGTDTFASYGSGVGSDGMFEHTGYGRMVIGSSAGTGVYLLGGHDGTDAATVSGALSWTTSTHTLTITWTQANTDTSSTTCRGVATAIYQ